jgi:hypothetical protein
VTVPPPSPRTQRLLRTAPLEVVQGTLRLFEVLHRVLFVLVLACALLGIWHDLRWFATGGVLVFAWVVTHLSADAMNTELHRRQTEAAAACPDVVEGD